MRRPFLFLLPVHFFGKFASDRSRADEGLGQARSVRESADCKLRGLAFQFLFGEGDFSQLENLSNALARRSCCGLGTRDEHNPVRGVGPLDLHL